MDAALRRIREDPDATLGGVIASSAKKSSTNLVSTELIEKQRKMDTTKKQMETAYKKDLHKNVKNSERQAALLTPRVASPGRVEAALAAAGAELRKFVKPDTDVWRSLAEKIEKREFPVEELCRKLLPPRAAEEAPADYELVFDEVVARVRENPGLLGVPGRSALEQVHSARRVEEVLRSAGDRLREHIESEEMLRELAEKLERDEEMDIEEFLRKFGVEEEMLSTAAARVRENPGLLLGRIGGKQKKQKYADVLRETKTRVAPTETTKPRGGAASERRRGRSIVVEDPAHDRGYGVSGPPPGGLYSGPLPALPEGIRCA